MRIAIIAQEYPPETAKGGIGTQAYLKAHGLTALGHEVHVISRCAKGGPALRHRRDDDGVNLIRIPGFEARMGVQTEVADWITYSAEVAAEIASLHERAALDLVEFPEWAAEGYVHFLNQTEWNHIASAVQLHGPLAMFAHALGWPDVDSEFYRTGTQLEATCVRLADAVYSSSACSADWAAQHYGIRRDRIRVLHTGVDTALFHPTGDPKAGRPTIVFAGKLVPNKGVVTLVDAAARLVREFPSLRLQLLGRGEAGMMAQLRDRAGRVGATELLEFAGFVDRSELPRHLSRALIFAMPSPYEGGPGLVYLEAMACGVPVVACAGSGAAEVVREGETGLLVPPNNVDSLVVALRSLLADRTRCDEMGARARRFTVAEADTTECVKAIEGFYRGVVAAKRGPVPELVTA